MHTCPQLSGVSQVQARSEEYLRKSASRTSGYFRWGSEHNEVPRPPNAPLFRALWSLFVVLSILLEGSWVVLEVAITTMCMVVGTYYFFICVLLVGFCIL